MDGIKLDNYGPLNESHVTPSKYGMRPYTTSMNSSLLKKRSISHLFLQAWNPQHSDTAALALLLPELMHLFLPLVGPVRLSSPICKSTSLTQYCVER
ncbi:hypothetical protein V6N13_026937 [Hibiscus sabdariffa]